MINKGIGLYVHVPFCEKKCPYCDFFSVGWDQCLIDQYLQNIFLDMKKWSNINRSVQTIYFGGGTPSLLGSQRIKNIMDQIKKNFNVIDDEFLEVTLEMNPSTLEMIDLEKLLCCGVNRLSIGLQSSNNKELKLLGRSHNVQMVQKVVEQAQTAGFRNISLDLMIGIPEQTEKSLIDSINFCSQMNVQHVSMYMLKIEPGTKFYKDKSILSLPNEDVQCNQYLLACEKLEGLGFRQYEISNFCKSGYEGKHNLKYWNTEEYLGLGPSAHSFLDGNRFYLEKSLNKCSCVQDGLGGSEQEYIMLRLRLSEGLENAKFKERFGHDLSKRYIQNARRYEKLGFVKIDSKSIKLTQRGFLLSNQLISKLLD